MDEDEREIEAELQELSSNDDDDAEWEDEDDELGIVVEQKKTRRNKNKRTGVTKAGNPTEKKRYKCWPDSTMNKERRTYNRLRACSNMAVAGKSTKETMGIKGRLKINSKEMTISNNIFIFM